MKKELKKKLTNSLSTKKTNNHTVSDLPSYFLEDPGDHIFMYVSASNRLVFIAEKNDGSETYSRVIYENGTYVETHSVHSTDINNKDNVILEV